MRRCRGPSAIRSLFGMIALVVVVGGVGLAAYFISHHGTSPSQAGGAADVDSPGLVVANRVIVTRPSRGGLPAS